MKRFTPLLVVGVLALAGAGCGPSAPSNTSAPSTPYSNTAPTPSAMAKGRVVFVVKDASTDLSGVTSVMLTVDKVEAHSTSTGWVTVSSGTKQYDLLQLKKTGAAQLLADIQLSAGTYDQVRLDISKVMVTANGKTQEAKLPSHTLKLVGSLTVTGGQTSLMSFDFILDKSLHLTGNGMYILAPVVHLQSEDNADVEVDADESVKVNAGDIETDEQDGMDESGDMKANFELPEHLDIDAKGMIKIGS
jgi:hypothetical protein